MPQIHMIEQVIFTTDQKHFIYKFHRSADLKM